MYHSKTDLPCFCRIIRAAAADKGRNQIYYALGRVEVVRQVSAV